MSVGGIQFLIACTVFLAVFCLFAITWLKRRDVVTG
jgi:ABC-2 type transport system permease protein